MKYKSKLLAFIFQQASETNNTQACIFSFEPTDKSQTLTFKSVTWTLQAINRLAK